MIAAALVWAGVVFLLMQWQAPHERTRRFGNHTYYPHVSHFVTWLFLGVTTALWSIFFASESSHPGPLLILPISAWHVRNALLLLVAWRQGKTIEL